MTSIPPVGAVPIQSVSPPGGAGSSTTTGNSTGSAKSTSGFGELFNNVVGQANGQMKAAGESVQQLTEGKSDDLQNVVMSMAKADLSFRFILEIRNKLMDAYQEIMRMQV